MNLSTRIRNTVGYLLSNDRDTITDTIRLMVDHKEVYNTRSLANANWKHANLLSDGCTLLSKEGPIRNANSEIIIHYASGTYAEWCDAPVPKDTKDDAAIIKPIPEDLLDSLLDVVDITDEIRFSVARALLPVLDAQYQNCINAGVKSSLVHISKYTDWVDFVGGDKEANSYYSGNCNAVCAILGDKMGLKISPYGKHDIKLIG